MSGTEAFYNVYLQGGWPTMILLDEDLNIVSMPTDADYYQAVTDAGSL